MGSWGHYVRLLSDEECQSLERSRERWGPRFYTCGVGRQPNRCEQPSTHMTGYRYITGRAGRVSSAEQHRCTEHAKRFADKHGLEMPMAATARLMRTGGDLVADALAQIAKPTRETK